MYSFESNPPFPPCGYPIYVATLLSSTDPRDLLILSIRFTLVMFWSPFLGWPVPFVRPSKVTPLSTSPP